MVSSRFQTFAGQPKVVSSQHVTIPFCIFALETIRLPDFSGFRHFFPLGSVFVGVFRVSVIFFPWAVCLWECFSLCTF